jgi:hypothetical protein
VRQITPRFCRIPLDGSVPHPTTLIKLSTRCGSAAAAGLNEALLTKAAEAKVLRTSWVRADTTVVPAIVCYPTDSGLLAKAIRRIGKRFVSEKHHKIRLVADAGRNMSALGAAVLLAIAVTGGWLSETYAVPGLRPAGSTGPRARFTRTNSLAVARADCSHPPWEVV